MYQSTLALRDNPFGPDPTSFTQDLSRPEYLTDLDISPLRVDQCPDVTPLFCLTILNLSGHMDRFHALMYGRHYRFSPPQRRGSGSAVVVLRGAQGAGKTTLASWMISEMMKLPGLRPWRAFELPRPPVAFRAWTEMEFETATLKLKSEIEDGSQAGDHIAVLLEDVATWNRAVGLLEQFKNRSRFSVITTHDLNLLDEDPRSLGGSVLVEVFTLAPVKPEDAENYVRHRVKLFRDPDRPEITAVSPMFPFTQSSIRRCVANSGPVGAGSPVTLRVLNTQLRSRIDEQHEAVIRRGLADVGSADPGAPAKLRSCRHCIH